jgi:hypothetical protein
VRRLGLPGRVVLGWYLATPVFALLDLAFGINVRASFLDEQPALRLAWYALALGCAAAVTRWPARAGVIGLSESAASIALLVLGAGVAYLGALDAALGEPAVVAPPFSPADVANLVLSAGALIASYIAAQARVSRDGF